MKEFAGKHCVITGAARGIGRAVAERLASQGADIALMDINEELLQKTGAALERYGTQIITVTCDLSRKTEIDHAMARIEKSFGHIDILAACAGIVTSELMINVSESDWDKVMDINLKSVFMLSSACARNMIDNQVKNGKILIISSQASKIGEIGNGVYCISKAGINMLVQILGLELAQYGICVNAVSPGCVNTEMIQEVFQKRSRIEGMTPDEYKKLLTNNIPLGRLAEPGEIADFMLFLAGSNAGYITGISHTIAGGKTLF
jgi:NAD(P)-dependent dehydrogenase (short-subunit alcohol dehydrogenase family)